MVDIDPAETGKFARLGRRIDRAINADARAFLRALLRAAQGGKPAPRREWLERIAGWKARYPACPPEFAQGKAVNPYWFVKQLAGRLQEDEIIFSDTGCALAWMMQGFEFRRGQRFFHAFNNTPMGYGLPGAIGASFARPGRRVVLVTGDGSLQMSLYELATVMRHKLPIKILMFNNDGHGMVRQTQDMWLEGKHYATSVGGGLAFPDFVAVARAYGMRAEALSLNQDIGARLASVLEAGGPAFLDIRIEPDQGVAPQVKFGRPNEDAEPLLERKEFLENMIVDPLPVSRQPL